MAPRSGRDPSMKANPRSDERGQIAPIDSIGPSPTGTAGGAPVMPPSKVLCPLHGIRTHAEWQRALADLAISRGWVCRLERWSYGRFSLPAFLSPWTREAKLGWLLRQYDAEIHDRRLDIEVGQ